MINFQSVPTQKQTLKLLELKDLLPDFDLPPTVMLVDVGERQCRWPSEGPEGPMCCGRPTALKETVYCINHQIRSHRPGAQQRVAAPQPSALSAESLGL